MASVIDRHPQRDKIIEAILSGQTLREVAKRFNVTAMVVHRYKRNVVVPAVRNAPKLMERKPEAAEAIATVQQTVAVTKASVAGDPIVQRLLDRQARRDELLRKAAEKNDFKGFAALDTCEHRDIRLEAELTGRLQTAGSNAGDVTVILAPIATIPAVMGQPAVIDVQAEHGESLIDSGPDGPQ